MISVGQEERARRRKIGMRNFRLERPDTRKGVRFGRDEWEASRCLAPRTTERTTGRPSRASGPVGRPEARGSSTSRAGSVPRRRRTNGSRRRWPTAHRSGVGRVRPTGPLASHCGEIVRQCAVRVREGRIAGGWCEHGSGWVPTGTEGDPGARSDRRVRSDATRGRPQADPRATTGRRTGNVRVVRRRRPREADRCEPGGYSGSLCVFRLRPYGFRLRWRAASLSRQKYHAATERNGRNDSPVAASSAGASSSGRSYAEA